MDSENKYFNFQIYCMQQLNNISVHNLKGTASPKVDHFTKLAS